jgi:hypothetical protein
MFYHKTEGQVKYKYKENLLGFLKDCELELLKEEERRIVEYPKAHIDPWDSDKITNRNEQLLCEIGGKANVYAIFTSEQHEAVWRLRYIGQTKSKIARSRLRNHLIAKSEETGAKLAKIIDHVKAGGSVKVSWISVTPESLRHYVEEELIKKHREADWNVHV